jgi:hypothetical protein
MVWYGRVAKLLFSNLEKAEYCQFIRAFCVMWPLKGRTLAMLGMPGSNVFFL